jgi:hypothetical protein
MIAIDGYQGAAPAKNGTWVASLTVYLFLSFSQVSSAFLLLPLRSFPSSSPLSPSDARTHGLGIVRGDDGVNIDRHHILFNS